MFHQLTILGRLGGDPELRYTPANKAVVNLSVAVTEKWGDQEKTVWYRATAWEKRAEVLSQYFKKGDMIFLVGRPNPPGAWISNDEARAQNEFTIDQFSFVGGGSGQSNGSAPAQPAATPATEGEDLGDIFTEEEIPF